MLGLIYSPTKNLEYLDPRKQSGGRMPLASSREKGQQTISHAFALKGAGKSIPSYCFV